MEYNLVPPAPPGLHVNHWTCFRDLGSSLNNVRVLWMAQCGLMDLESVSSMSGLRELYLAYNELTDISPCSMLDELRILDVEG